jgi:hypothetical protein
MSLISDVQEYEKWLRCECDVDEDGLRAKHTRMAKDAFKFFRASCFRFARKLPKLLPGNLCDAPVVPSVGDAHIENWGTWRDGEGRLVWGVNDFDDATLLPYTYDLVRLATSTRLAPGLPGARRDRVASILEGYREGLEHPGPIFADDERPWLQGLVLRPSAKPGAFWDYMDGLKEIPEEEVPSEARKALEAASPAFMIVAFYCRRQSGGGSLGRPRYLVVGEWQGGAIVREAKALVPSSWNWASGRTDRVHLLERVARGASRSPDPFLRLQDGYVVRRLAPDAAKIDLAEEDAAEFGPELLSAMGFDLASIHSQEGAEEDIIEHLDSLPENWLHKAAKRVAEAVETDAAHWQSRI